MTPAVKAAIEELNAEFERLGHERDRITSTIEALEQYAGGGNGTAAPKPARRGSGGGVKCDQCDKVCATPHGLAVHKARAHG